MLSASMGSVRGKYLIVGMAGAGKTTLLERLKIGSISDSPDGLVKSLRYDSLDLLSWDLPGRRGNFGVAPLLTRGLSSVWYVVPAR